MGYVILNYVIGRCTDNFTVLLAVVTAFYLFSSFRLIKRYSSSAYMSITMMFTMSLLYLAVNIQRQCIAMAIFYLAIPLLEQKKRIRYCILIALATTFHTASIILFSLPFLPRIDFGDKKNLRRWILVSAAALVFMNYGVNWILSYFPYFQHYYTSVSYTHLTLPTNSRV